MGDISAHFSRSEFACRCGCGFNTVDTDLLVVLETVRQYYGKPVTPSSGCRCPARNKAESGSKNSQHLLGRACDFVVQDIDPEEVQDFIDDMWADKWGLGRYDTFTHVDSRSTKARWDNRGGG